MAKDASLTKEAAKAKKANEKNSKKAAHKRNTETMHMVCTSYVSGLCHKRENPQKNIWLNMFNPAGQS